ncbi:uncharacterized protein PSFLO_03302 [Pseudozyma flocculosa]|uniref:RecQ-mediated genome instability protein 1 n=1 Tax=Pseudozyma flocculosa TaxID=84751 RepID=A0A5C3F1D5_9BASI|nr:uncharacterized protein PSFLO_03302 [Pseudozyma flocculosa]
MATEAVPIAVTRLLSARYPTLELNPAWLSQCVAYLRSLPGPSRPTTDDQLAKQVRQQLLAADLATAARRGALAGDMRNVKDGAVGAGPKKAVMVQVVSIVDIGISAATQLEVAEARKAARSTLGGAALLNPATSTLNATASARDLDEGRVAIDEDAAHMADFNAKEEKAGIQATVFPRKMLQLELSDGHGPPVTAFELERVAGLDMNQTRLGCKILLAPRCVTIEGGEVEEWEAEAESRLINKLRQKLGKAPLEPTSTGDAAAERTGPTAQARASTASSTTTKAARRPLPSASHTNGRTTSKPEALDDFHFDDDEDESFLLAAAEMETDLVAPASTAPPRRPESASRGSTSVAPKREQGGRDMVETIVLSDSEDEKPGASGTATQSGPPIKHSREDAIVIESSPEP